jgi:hypothetical protein
MRGYLAVRVTGINLGFEDLNLLPGDLCPLDTPNKLFGLAREHTSANDLDPASRVMFRVRAERPLVLHKALLVVSQSPLRLVIGCQVLLTKDERRRTTDNC